MPVVSRTAERFGRVTVFPHRKQFYCRYREDGLNKRHALGDQGPESLLKAAFLSAKLIAKDAGIDLSTFARQALNLHVSATSVGDAGADLPELRDSFLAHHDTVLHSAIATVSRSQLKPERRSRQRSRVQAADKDESTKPAPWTLDRFVSEMISDQPATEGSILVQAIESGLSERQAKRFLHVATEQGKTHRWNYANPATPHRFAIVAQPVTLTEKP